MISHAAKKFLPWIVTVVALYLTFRSVDFSALGANLKNAEASWILVAIVLTSASYLLRSRRWQFLFPSHTMSFATSARVLILGFFMNNVLPARTGEFVRAHMGARATGETRTLVLATIASERLIDGVTLSVMFIAAAYGMRAHPYSQNLAYVAYFFVCALAGVGVLLSLRERIFVLIRRIGAKLNHKASDYAFDRVQIFINGLMPMFTLSRAPVLCLWSVIIWSIELFVYVAVAKAFGASLTMSMCVLFLATVNFSSLIPAAPGGIGVIEAFASTVLVSLGLDKEHALAMVIAQHMIQYLVVGVPGALVLLTWKKEVELAKESQSEAA